MLTTIIDRFTRPSSPSPGTTTDEATLLAGCNLPDPADLRRQLAEFESQVTADDAAWDRLDRTSNPRAWMEQTKIAERRERLQMQIVALKSQIAAAETRRAAFVALIEILDGIDEQIDQESRRLYADVLLVSKDQRRARLESLDGLVRLRARIAAPLAVVSPLRKFRRASDPFAALAHDLRATADEIDRHHAPGMPRAPITWPADAHELIAMLNEGRPA